MSVRVPDERLDELAASVSNTLADAVENLLTYAPPVVGNLAGGHFDRANDALAALVADLRAARAELADWSRVAQHAAFKLTAAEGDRDEAQQGVEYALACIGEWQENTRCVEQERDEALEALRMLGDDSIAAAERWENQREELRADNQRLRIALSMAAEVHAAVEFDTEADNAMRDSAVETMRAPLAEEPRA